MRDMLRTSLLCLACLLAGLAIARSCSGPPPVVVDAAELQRIAEERAALAADVAREHRLIEERAEELAALPLYERIAELVPPAVIDPPRRPASVSGSAGPLPMNPDPSAIGKPGDRCHPTGDGWARCPEAVLDRLTLRVIAAESDRDAARLDLDAERAYRRLDAEAWAVEREGYARALDKAKPPAPWRLPAAVVSGAAIATGIALAATGSEGAGLAVGGAGLVVGIAAVAF
jgi:hypothetical protein